MPYTRGRTHYKSVEKDRGIVKLVINYQFSDRFDACTLGCVPWCFARVFENVYINQIDRGVYPVYLRKGGKPLGRLRGIGDVTYRTCVSLYTYLSIYHSTTFIKCRVHRVHSNKRSSRTVDFVCTLNFASKGQRVHVTPPTHRRTLLRKSASSVGSDIFTRDDTTERTTPL